MERVLAAVGSHRMEDAQSETRLKREFGCNPLEERSIQRRREQKHGKRVGRDKSS